MAVLDGQARADHGLGLTDLSDDKQDEMLARAAGGKLDGTKLNLLDGAQMRLWFEDVRTDAVRIYVSHPATLAALG